MSLQELCVQNSSSICSPERNPMTSLTEFLLLIFFLLCFPITLGFSLNVFFEATFQCIDLPIYFFQSHLPLFLVFSSKHFLILLTVPVRHQNSFFLSFLFIILPFHHYILIPCLIAITCGLCVSISFFSFF